MGSSSPPALPPLGGCGGLKRQRPPLLDAPPVHLVGSDATLHARHGGNDFGEHPVSLLRRGRWQGLTPCHLIVEEPYLLLWESWRKLLFFSCSLHPLVIIPNFLFQSYFAKGKGYVRGVLLHIYTIWKGRKGESGETVCTSSANRVHTHGGVSSDLVL